MNVHGWTKSHCIAAADIKSAVEPRNPLHGCAWMR
jgi:hypothetical protein